MGPCENLTKVPTHQVYVTQERWHMVRNPWGRRGYLSNGYIHMYMISMACTGCLGVEF